MEFSGTRWSSLVKRTVRIALILATVAVAMAIWGHGRGPCPCCSLAPGETCQVADQSAAAKVPTLAPPREQPAQAADAIARFRPQGQIVYVTVEAEAGLAGGLR